MNTKQKQSEPAAKPAHTPRPWNVFYNPKRPNMPNRIVRFDGRVIVDDSQASVAISASERAANARLIAAAPQLLAALEKALPLVESLVFDGEPYFDVQEQMRAAIAEAEGGNDQ